MTLASLPAPNFTGADLSARVNAALVETRAGRRFSSVSGLLTDATMAYGTGSRAVMTGDLVEAGGHRYEVAAAGSTDQHLTTAGGVKLKVLPGAEGYDVTAFGSGGAALAAAWAAAVAGNNAVVYPAGTFLHSAKITAALAVSGSPALRRTLRVRGAGSALTTLVFSSTDGIEITGAASAGVNNGDHRLIVSGLTIQQPAIARTGTALKVTDMSGLTLDDVLITGFGFGVDLVDVLTLKADRLKVQYSGTGLRSRLGNYSNANLSRITSSSFAACWDAFADVRGCNIAFDTCGFEGLGLGSEGDRGDLLAVGLAYQNSPDGYAGLSLANCYFENNKGEADVLVDALWTGSYAFTGTNFNRASTARCTTSNIALRCSNVGSEQHVTVEDCGFLGVGTYVASAARPKIKIENAGGFDNWHLLADRAGNVGLFSGADAFDLGSASLKQAYQTPRMRRGSWTPTVEGDLATPGAGTYTTQTGCYERIGDMVFFSAHLRWTAHTGTGTFKLSLPPVAPATASTPNQPVSLVYSGPSYAADQQMCAYVRPALNTSGGTGCIQVLRGKPDGTLAATVINGGATYELWVSGAYRAA